MFDEIDLTRIQDEQTRELIVRLLNVIEQQATMVRDLQIKNIARSTTYGKICF